MSDEFSSKEFFETMQKMWNPLSLPFPGMMPPAATVEEVQKKIAELQTIEGWLKMNVGFVQMAVKALQLQESALEALAANNKDSQS